MILYMFLYILHYYYWAGFEYEELVDTILYVSYAFMLKNMFKKRERIRRTKVNWCFGYLL